MFESVALAPPDAIFGLNEAMRSDPRDGKINLGAGVYKDEAGRTPVLRAVKEAERRLLETETSKSYLPIEGDHAYDRAVRQLVLGGEHPAVREERALTAQTPGGTAALRVVADTLARLEKKPRLWLSDPTWANHGAIFTAAGLEQVAYPYYDPTSHGLAYEVMLRAFEGLEPGDVVLLHGCCHNPTGVDPSAAQWRQLGDLLAEKGAMPLLDFAYQGFVTGVEEDAAPVRLLAERLPEVIICSSFSKNLGLYAERVGAATLVARDSERATAVMSQLKRSIRVAYSNPPTHGGSVAAAVLGDEELRAMWLEELAEMRGRIQNTRRLLAAELTRRQVSLSADGNGFIAAQNGMFSFSGLDRGQVQRLREEHAVYMVDSGRLNVAGITEDNVGRLCDAIAAVSA